jgi:hypothetical protein
MTFQVWLRELLADAIARNRAHIVALLGPSDLRQLYVEGAPPSIDAIFSNGTSVDLSASAEMRVEHRKAGSTPRKIA